MIGVCIKYFHKNYGGILQAFATTQIFEDRNITYELIRYKKSKSWVFVIKSIPRLFNCVLLNDKYEAFQKKIHLIRHKDFAQKDAIRRKAFYEFIDLHFTKCSQIYHGLRSLSINSVKYSAIVSGSDQLWSPAGLPSNFYNLQFVPDNIIKISFASSFGVKRIPFYQLRRTSEYLKRIDFISMRENRGSEIVKELINRDVPVVLDPVLKFNADQWDKMIPRKCLYNEPYIFTYFLGKNAEHRKAVEELKNKTGCHIVTLRHLDQFVPADENFGDYAPYDVGPEDFLNLLRFSEYICTDSFHASAFSILYKKKFMIFNRYNEQSHYTKNSRIDTLCSNLGLEERRFCGEIVETMLYEIDYKTVESKLSDLRIKTDEYLDEAFNCI